MSKILVALVCVLGFVPAIAGCRAPEKYGNFTDVDSTSLMNDAIVMMLANYPPAQTRLNLLHDPVDSFGVKFVRMLRTSGYAVSEYTNKPKEKDKYSESGLGFAFILDEFKPDKEYQFTLFIGTDVIGRSYAVRGSADARLFVGLGSWSRRR